MDRECNEGRRSGTKEEEGGSTRSSLHPICFVTCLRCRSLPFPLTDVLESKRLALQHRRASSANHTGVGTSLR